MYDSFFNQYVDATYGYLHICRSPWGRIDGLRVLSVIGFSCL